MVGIRELEAIAAIVAHSVTIALAREVSFKANIRGPIHWDLKSEIAHAVVLEAPTGYMTFGPDLFADYRRK